MSTFLDTVSLGFDFYEGWKALGQAKGGPERIYTRTVDTINRGAHAAYGSLQIFDVFVRTLDLFDVKLKNNQQVILKIALGVSDIARRVTDKITNSLFTKRNAIENIVDISTCALVRAADCAYPTAALLPKHSSKIIAYADQTKNLASISQNTYRGYEIVKNLLEDNPVLYKRAVAFIHTLFATQQPIMAANNPLAMQGNNVIAVHRVETPDMPFFSWVFRQQKYSQYLCKGSEKFTFDPMVYTKDPSIVVDKSWLEFNTENSKKAVLIEGHECTTAEFILDQKIQEERKQIYTALVIEYMEKELSEKIEVIDQLVDYTQLKRLPRIFDCMINFPVRCGISGRAVLYPIRARGTQPHLAVYYEKETLYYWKKDHPGENPPGWPEDVEFKGKNFLNSVSMREKILRTLQEIVEKMNQISK